MCAFVCFFPLILRTSSSLDVPAGVTQEEGQAGFFYPPSFCGACLNFSREKDSAILSFVDREAEFCVLTIQSFSTRWAFYFLFFIFYFFSEKNPVYRNQTHVPTCQKVITRLPLSYRGDRLVVCNLINAHTHRINASGIEWLGWQGRIARLCAI